MPVYEVYDERLGKDYRGHCLIIANNPRDAAIRFDRDHSNSPDNVITVVVVESKSKWRVTRELSTSITYEAEPVPPEPEPVEYSPEVKYSLRVAAVPADGEVCGKESGTPAVDPPVDPKENLRRALSRRTAEAEAYRKAAKQVMEGP